MSFFYARLNFEELKFVEMMWNEGFLQKSLDKAFECLEELAEKYHTWSVPNLTESTARTQTSGGYQLREEDGIKAKLGLITMKLDALEAKDRKFFNRLLM